MCNECLLFTTNNSPGGPRGSKLAGWAVLEFGRPWIDLGLIEVWGLAMRSEGLANRSERLGAGPCR